MIVYGDHPRVESAAAALAGAGAGLGRLAASGTPEDANAALADAGAVESAIVDALAPEADDLGSVTCELRRALETVGEAVRAAQLGERDRARAAAARAAAMIATLAASAALPARIELRAHEGFAFYALYPQAWLEPVRLALCERRPERALVVGLRSIGAPLSALVTAALRAGGVDVRSLTLRPRGHPFARTARLSAELAAWIPPAARRAGADRRRGARALRLVARGRCRDPGRGRLCR